MALYRDVDVDMNINMDADMDRDISPMYSWTSRVREILTSLAIYSGFGLLVFYIILGFG